MATKRIYLVSDTREAMQENTHHIKLTQEEAEELFEEMKADFLENETPEEVHADEAWEYYCNYDGGTCRIYIEEHEIEL